MLITQRYHDYSITIAICEFYQFLGRTIFAASKILGKKIGALFRV